MNHGGNRNCYSPGIVEVPEVPSAPKTKRDLTYSTKIDLTADQLDQTVM